MVGWQFTTSLSPLKPHHHHHHCLKLASEQLGWKRGSLNCISRKQRKNFLVNLANWTARHKKVLTLQKIITSLNSQFTGDQCGQVQIEQQNSFLPVKNCSGCCCRRCSVTEALTVQCRTMMIIKKKKGEKSKTKVAFSRSSVQKRQPSFSFWFFTKAQQCWVCPVIVFSSTILAHRLITDRAKQAAKKLQARKWKGTEGRQK